jgi:transcription elongation factor Elf1
VDKCPKCGSEDVGCEDDDVHDDVTVHHMRCESCGQFWTVAE